MPKDILLTQRNGYLDINFTSSDLVLEHGFDTALLMSLFNEKRANDSEVPRVEMQRGWWGNTVSDYDNYEIGSKNWLLDQARATPASLNLAKTYTSDGLQWLLDDNYCKKIDVDTSYTVGNMNIDIKIYRSNDVVSNHSYQLWNNTNYFEGSL